MTIRIVEHPDRAELREGEAIREITLDERGRNPSRHGGWSRYGYERTDKAIVLYVVASENAQRSWQQVRAFFRLRPGFEGLTVKTNRRRDRCK